MAAMNPSSSNRPSGRTVVLAFAVAIAAAVALVAVALIGRSDSSAPPTATPVVDLTGIPQDGRVLGSPDAEVTLVEWADPQCPACRTYTEEFFPTVVDEYVRPGRVNTEFRGFPFIGDDSVEGVSLPPRRRRAGQALGSPGGALPQPGRRERRLGDGRPDPRARVRRSTGSTSTSCSSTRSATTSSPRPTARRQPAQAAGIQGTPTLQIVIGDQEPYDIQVANVDQLRAALDDALDG